MVGSQDDAASYLMMGACRSPKLTTWPNLEQLAGGPVGIVQRQSVGSQRRHLH